MYDQRVITAQTQIDAQADAHHRYEWLTRHLADWLVTKQYDAIDNYVRQCPEFSNVPIYDYVFEICDDRALVRSFCQNPESSALELATGFVEYITGVEL